MELHRPDVSTESGTPRRNLEVPRPESRQVIRINVDNDVFDLVDDHPERLAELIR